MMHNKKKMAVSAKPSPLAELEFMDKMIEHHQAAIDMVRQYMGRFVHSELKQLGQNIITAQSAEIKQMQGWQSQWAANIETEKEARRSNGSYGL